MNGVAKAMGNMVNAEELQQAADSDHEAAMKDYRLLVQNVRKHLEGSQPFQNELMSAAAEATVKLEREWLLRGGLKANVSKAVQYAAAELHRLKKNLALGVLAQIERDRIVAFERNLLIIKSGEGELPIQAAAAAAAVPDAAPQTPPAGTTVTTTTTTTTATATAANSVPPIVLGRLPNRAAADVITDSMSSPDTSSCSNNAGKPPD